VTTYIKALDNEITRLRKVSLSEDDAKMVVVYSNRIIGLEWALKLAKQQLK
jgi:hypothetical protein